MHVISLNSVLECNAIHTNHPLSKNGVDALQEIHFANFF